MRLRSHTASIAATLDSKKEDSKAMGIPEEDVDEQKTTLLYEGWEVILDYLNYGNSMDVLDEVQSQARIWCRQYFDEVGFKSSVPTAVMEAHPHLFNLTIASWLRLDSSSQWAAGTPESSSAEDEERYSRSRLDGYSSPLSRGRTTSRSSNRRGPPSKPVYTETTSCGTPEEGTVSFPSYSEPSIDSDDELYEDLAHFDLARTQTQAEAGEDHDDPDRYYRVIFNAADLWGSPIMYHFPEVIRNIANLDIDVMADEEIDSDYRDALPELVWAKVDPSPHPSLWPTKWAVTLSYIHRQALESQSRAFDRQEAEDAFAMDQSDWSAAESLILMHQDVFEKQNKFHNQK